MISGKTIFISPLDWGLGHSSRCVPIIRSLSGKNTVIIGITKLNASFFDNYFPDLQKVEVPSYEISYSKKLPLWLKLVSQWPKINAVIKKEKRLLEKIISDHKINFVISDNRFGLTNKNTHCVFITHQLNIQVPFFSFVANLINRKYIHRFNEVWIPDYENRDLRLSGQLSDSSHIKIPVKYIEPKSALENFGSKIEKNAKTDYLILLSGIEPQRSILEKLLIEKFSTSKQKIVLVRGSNSFLKTKNHTMELIDFAYGEKLNNLIVNAETVICRSGFSTLMDLHLLNKKQLILIPTPGQSEQEYLAAYWKKKFGARELLQKAIKLYSFR